MKKTIKIAHLYYDLMNLYGETGNVKALTKKIEDQNVDTEVHFLTIGDKIDFKKFDIYYMGAGSEYNEALVLNDLMKYKDDIVNAIENNKMFIITGSALEMFGKEIITEDKTIECLSVFDFVSKEEPERLVKELVYTFDELPLDKGYYILGFQNARSSMMYIDKNIFNSNDNIRYKNFFGMNFIGPVLVRNPYFLDYLMEILFNQLSLNYVSNDETLEYRAYHTFINTFIKKQ